MRYAVLIALLFSTRSSWSQDVPVPSPGQRLWITIETDPHPTWRDQLNPFHRTQRQTIGTLVSWTADSLRLEIGRHRTVESFSQSSLRRALIYKGNRHPVAQRVTSIVKGAGVGFISIGLLFASTGGDDPQSCSELCFSSGALFFIGGILGLPIGAVAGAVSPLHQENPWTRIAICASFTGALSSSLLAVNGVDRNLGIAAGIGGVLVGTLVGALNTPRDYENWQPLPVRVGLWPGRGGYVALDFSLEK